MSAKTKPFPTEAAMCAHFIAGLPRGWTAYAETAGWDILLVRDADGFQIGVQAKLRLNAEVFDQALERGSSYSVTNPGPDCRAVMVPSDASGPYEKIAAYCGITIIRVMSPGAFGNRRGFTPSLPAIKEGWMRSDDWHECCPTSRHRLPEYVPDVAAGSAAPVQLTDWKIKAIKIAATIELRGYVTRADFKHHAIDRRRWVAERWITNENGVDRYTAGRMPDFKAQHPRVWDEIVRDQAKWMFVPAPVIPKQAVLV